MKSTAVLSLGITALSAFAAAMVQAQPVICSGRWCNPYYFAVGTDPTGVALGDFDGDRWTDIAVAVKGDDKVTILTNSGGDAKFDPPVDIALAGGSAPHSIAAVDIDNDQDLDLVVTRSGMDDVQLLTNTGGAFSLGATTVVGGTLPSDLAVGDIDDNGFMDVATSNRSSSDVSVLLNTAGVLAGGVTYAVGAEPRGLALADLDGEGSLDMAVASVTTGAVDILINDGNGLLVLDSSLPVGTNLSPNGDVATGDFNADQKNDIAVVTTGSAGDFATIFLNLGAAGFGAPSHFESDEDHPVNDTGSPTALAAGDYDLTGTVDLVLTNLDSNRMGNLQGDGTGVFGKPNLVRVLETPVDIVAGDVDGNGSDDLITANQGAGNVGVLVNSFVFFADGFEWGDTWAWSDEVQ
jgi:hypothetical protein